jgi:acetyl esterase/lipase
MLRYFLIIPMGLLLAVAMVVLATEYVAARPSLRSKDLAYVARDAPDFDTQRHRLDVYAPRQKSPQGRPVVLFIHGGNWNSGSKNIYTFVGRRLARQGMVAVVISYRLAPAVKVPQIADDCARALAWTVQHIAGYGGDANRIYVMGHSAGGGLAALLATDDELLARHGLSRNPVRGAILDDPGGLDMYTYLMNKSAGDMEYHDAFGDDQAGWKLMSPIYKLKPGAPPFLMFIGEKTLPGISSSAARFRKRVQAVGQEPLYQVLPGKHHVAMVLQLYWKNNVIYRELRKLTGAV